MNSNLIQLNTTSIATRSMDLNALIRAASVVVHDERAESNGYAKQLSSASPQLVLDKSTLEAMHSMHLLMEIAAAPNILNGFWDDLFRLIRDNQHDRALLTCVLQSRLSLILTEPCEGVEATRLPLETLYSLEKDSLARELAGCIIRCLDMARCLNLNIGAAFLLEIARNLQRGYKHGKTS